MDFSAKYESAKVIDSVITKKVEEQLTTEDEITELERQLAEKKAALRKKQESEM